MWADGDDPLPVVAESDSDSESIPDGVDDLPSDDDSYPAVLVVGVTPSSLSAYMAHWADADDVVLRFGRVCPRLGRSRSQSPVLE